LAHTNGRVEALKSIATQLLSAEVEALEEIGGGRNSRVYRLNVQPSHSYALKAYFRHASDKRARMRTEFDSLGFLWGCGVRNIPKPVIASPEYDFAIYEWVEGRRIGAQDVTDVTIHAATSFLCHLAGLCNQPGSGLLGMASEACFSGPALIENLRSRLEPLLSRDDDADLQAFLSSEFIPSFDRISDWSREHAGASFDVELSKEGRILSPSDFGFHNALQTPTGEVFFLDFEYFGWDDPAKTISDFLLHPAMALSSASKRQFAALATQNLSLRNNLARRVRAFYPLFGLKWCLILLNEFLPEQLLRRRFAGMTDQARQKHTEQLTKAKSKLRQILSEYEHLPYFD